MNSNHPIKYWIAKTLNTLNDILKGILIILMVVVTLPYLVVIALGIGAFSALILMNEKAEKLFNLKKANILIEIEKTKNSDEIESLKRELNGEEDSELL